MSGIFPEGFRPGFTLAPPVVAGPPSTVGENWSAAVDEQQRIYNTGALPRALGAQYDRLLSALQPEGVDSVGTDPDAVRNSLVNPYADSPFEYRPWGMQQRRRQSADDLADRFWQAFEALPDERKAQLGDMPKSRAELEAAVRADLQGVRGRAQDVSGRAGAMGTVAGFAGSMAGSLSDPVTLGSLAIGAGPMGPGAAGFARFVVSEALINAAAEAATLPSQAEARGFIGDPLKADEAIAQVLLAAGLGAGFAGVVGGAARGGPMAAQKVKDIIGKASDADLAAAFRKVVKVPGRTADAAVQTLERAAEEVRTVPAEISPATVRQHEERTAEAEAAVLQPVPAANRPADAPPPIVDTPAPAVAVAQAAADRPAQGRRLSAAEYDRLVRTVAGEASTEGQVGMQAVAHVILNRVAAGRWGDTVESVVTAPRQFEPWNRPDRRAWMESLTPDSPAWRAAAAAVDDALSGRAPDPTGGALSFLNPAIVEERRGGRPVELDRPGRQIGRHWFWNAPGGEAPARVFRAPVERFDPREILTDAEAYQFKAGGDAAGVTDRLMGVEQWDDLKAGTLILHQRLDGTLYVADGHQRLGLAQRLAGAGQDVQVDARVLRESEGISIEDARAFAAAKNIAEGTGTPIDAAKVLRARPDLFAALPPRSRLVRIANDLGRLGDEPFGMVINELVDPAHAAIVAARVADEAAQAGVMRLLAKAKPETDREARALVDEAIAAGFGREVQTSLFGDAEIADSLIVERAKIRSAAVRRLSRDRRVFETLTAEAERIRAAGNVLQEGENARRARLAGQAEEILDRLANRKGPVGDALAAAAARARADGRLGPAVDDFVTALRGALDGDGGDGLPGGAGGSVRPPAAEDGTLPAAADAPDDLTAGDVTPDREVTSLPDDATLSLFDAPAGPGQAAQAAELEADVARTFPATERTAQGDQTVLPGTEVTDADRVAARGRRGLTPDRAQRPADDGLFDVSGRGQADLVETAALARQAQAENAADTDFLQQLDLVCGVAGKGGAA